MPVKLTRVEGWPAKLSAAIEAGRTRPFRWGQHDCALFACACIEAITGVDLGAQVRGRYHCADEAEAIMEAVYGVPDVGGVADSLLGEPVPVTLARRGDVVLLDITHGPALGVCVGAVAAGAGPEGLVYVPMQRWLRAWRV